MNWLRENLGWLFGVESPSPYVKRTVEYIGPQCALPAHVRQVETIRGPDGTLNTVTLDISNTEVIFSVPDKFVNHFPPGKRIRLLVDFPESATKASE